VQAPGRDSGSDILVPGACTAVCHCLVVPGTGSRVQLCRAPGQRALLVAACYSDEQEAAVGQRSHSEAAALPCSGGRAS
jgi:hypothetical protein